MPQKSNTFLRNLSANLPVAAVQPASENIHEYLDNLQSGRFADLFITV